MMDDKLPAGYNIQKGSFCDNCPSFDPYIPDTCGRTSDGQWTRPKVLCKHFVLCERAYSIGRGVRRNE